MTFYVNWFFVTFVAREENAEPTTEAELTEKGVGLSTYVKVDDVDEYHKAAVSNGLRPDGEPGAGASGAKEFVLRDPDGYRLVFFEK